MATSVAPPNAEGSNTYTYSSQPRPVQSRPKFREQSQYNNIMYDRRIVRGNTYALHTLPASSQPDPLELQRQQESRRRTLARKRARDQLRPRSPEPVEGRKHTEVQTELYLEEITDRVEEADVNTQTDVFLDRPPTPLFVPAKTGTDVSTQIKDGDLFDFNLEVKPILEVLVGKTVEQALLEVMEEEELASLRTQQREFEENRNAEVVETQRLEEQERRRREEKDRRKQQQREALLMEKVTAEKIAARAFAQSYLSDLVPSVFNTLRDHGFFYDPVEREVELSFMPFLMNETIKALDKSVLARAMVDVIIREIVAKRLGIPVPDYTPQQSEPAVTEAAPTSQDPTTEPLEKVFGETEDQDLSPSVQSTEVPATELTTEAPTKATDPPTSEAAVEPASEPPADSAPTDNQQKMQEEPKDTTEETTEEPVTEIKLPIKEPATEEPAKPATETSSTEEVETKPDTGEPEIETKPTEDPETAPTTDEPATETEVSKETPAAAENTPATETEEKTDVQ